MKTDQYQVITDKILTKLESGVVPWVRPWNKAALFGGNPYNYASRKPYRGINTLLLANESYPVAAWLTYKQAQDMGAQVRKGEHGSKIYFYKPFVVEDKNATEEGKTRTIPLLREFTVFNVSQIDGLPELAAPVVAPPVTGLAQSLMSLATVKHGGDRAYYSIAQDAITLPQPSQFSTPDGYAAVGLHELTHWTGHSSRLAREYGKRFGDTAYAREELVAEMGAAYLCHACGIDAVLQHASYIDNWIKVLKADKRAIVVAAGAAQKAADYCLGMIDASKVEETEEDAIAA